MRLFKFLVLMFSLFNLVHAGVQLCSNHVIAYMSPHLNTVDFLKLRELSKEHCEVYSGYPIRTVRITIISPYINQEEVFLKYFLDGQKISPDATFIIDNRTLDKRFYESILSILSDYFADHKIDTIYFLNRRCEPIRINKFFFSDNDDQKSIIAYKAILEATKKLISKHYPHTFTHVKMKGFDHSLEELLGNNFEFREYNVKFLM